MYKLYTPKTATAETPAPGVLLLHGYQNDHETCAAYAIKLARRGAVVLCLDEYGHGSTTAGLINRGYVNHKVTVNYGEDSVEDGTARRMELLNTNHRLTTHNAHGLATALTWFSDTIGLDLTLAPTDQVAMTKEALVLIAMLAAVASLMAVMELLLTTPFFSKAVQPLPGEASVKPNGAWWRGAQDGWQSMGLGTAAASGRMGWGLLGRCALLVLCMLAYLYVLLFLCEKAFLLDFRFIWPVFKTFDAARFGQFCVYLPVFALFFILNNSKIMASARCKTTYQPGFKGFLGCWWRNALMMVGGILIIVLIEYIPFFMNIAPGADLLFGSTFGGPFMSLLILFVPQVLVFSVLCTYTYRRTGSVYVGALTAASLACWIVTGGSSML